MTPFTVLGAGGFVGSHLSSYLAEQGHEVHAVGRHDPIPGRPGHVVYCIGLTADFRQRPFDTVEAHVSELKTCLQSLSFESFTFLSSTRVYQRLPADEIGTEEAELTVNPNDPSDLYNLSKLMGESLCLAHANPAVRAVRLSNVYGGRDPSENFLTSVLGDAIGGGHVRLQTPPGAAKDYIAIDDVLVALERIPTRASSRLINLAAGQNVSNAEIASLLRRHLGCTVEEASSKASGVVFPPISIRRLREEVGLQPKSLADGFAALVADYRSSMSVSDPRTAGTAEAPIPVSHPQGRT